MKRLILKLLAFKIEWHWWFIMRYRKKGNALIDNGATLSSARLLNLSLRLDRHCFAAAKAKQKYEDICGITAILARVHTA